MIHYTVTNYDDLHFLLQRGVPRDEIRMYQPLISLDTSFEEWYEANYQMSLAETRRLADATGSPRDYDKIVDWCQRRYYKQLAAIKAAKQLTLQWED